jgi:ATP-dependent Clp protease ATP-binding subunit ClpA
LKRFLQKHVENQLARGLISGTVPLGSTVAFKVDHDELVLKAA